MSYLQIRSANPYRLREGVRVAPHRHAYGQLEVVIEGRYLLVEDERERLLPPGTWVWLAPHVAHGWRSESPVHCLTVKYSASGMSARDPFISGAPRNDAWLRHLPERVIAAWTAPSPKLKEISNQLLSAAYGLCEIAERKGSATNLDSNWSDLIAQLNQPTTLPLSLETMAKKVCLSPTHFRRNFKAWLGRPPRQYQIGKKMEWAKGVLEYTHIPMKEVVHQLGYSDLSAFSKAFARHFGKRPRDVRKPGSRRRAGK